MAKTLIAFYSRADENYFNGQIRSLSVGNTEKAANMLAEITGGELFKIEQVQPYAKSYNECIAQAQADQRRNARPELKAWPDSIDQYDTIYLGFPNYWSTMPMAVLTFLEHFDFTGKTIRPFCTHEGSGMGRSEADLKKACPTAIIKKGLAIHGAAVDRAGADLKQWAGQ